MPVFAQQLIDEKNAEIDHLNKHILQLQTAGDSSPDTLDAAVSIVSHESSIRCFIMIQYGSITLCNLCYYYFSFPDFSHHLG